MNTKSGTKTFGINRHFLRCWCSAIFLALAWLALSAAPAQATSYTLATSSLLVGPAAGSNSITLAVTPATGNWTATTNATWLHLSPANQSGTGSRNVVFSFDANAGATRTGTLTIGGLTLNITQAGSTYIAAQSFITLVSSNLNEPAGVALDSEGNVYFADSNNNAIKKWMLSNNTVTTLVSSNVSYPEAVALDGAGNVYFSDSGHNAIKKWTAANSNVTTLVSSGLYYPDGVMLDGAGNVYFADSGSNVVKEWTAANSNVTTLPISGLVQPQGLAMDVAGNIYIVGGSYDEIVQEWTPANSTLTTLMSPAQLYNAFDGLVSVAVDASGNVDASETISFTAYAIAQWAAANGTMSILASAPSYGTSGGVAVDGAGNLYFTDSENGLLNEQPHAFVDPTQKSETLAGGNDFLPAVLPATQNLSAPFAPTSDQPWLTITGVTNGVISFSCAPNEGTSRTAHISLLGQSIPVVQSGYFFTLATNAFLVSAAAGSNGVLLSVAPSTGTWTASANTSWLHLSSASQSGTGSATVVFSFDVNAGAKRVGTLTIAGQTVTVTQAGATLSTNELFEGLLAGSDSVVLTLNPSNAPWTATSNVSWLHLSAPNQSGADSTTIAFTFDADVSAARIGTLTIAGQTLTVAQAGATYSLGTTNCLEGPDAGSGSVVLAVSPNIGTWTATANTAWLHVSQGNQSGTGGANVVFSFDANSGATRAGTLTIGNQTLTVTQAGSTYVAATALTTLVSSGLNAPEGVAVDSEGNVYIADTGTNEIKEWTAANNAVITLVSEGLNNPASLALDRADNVYIADTYNADIKEWITANSNVATLPIPGLPWGLAADPAGDLYFTTQAGKLYERSAASQTTSLLVSGLSFPQGVALDAAGNVYFANFGSNTIEEWSAATSNVTTLVSGLDGPLGVAADGSGNVYFADNNASEVKEWSPATGNVTVLVSSAVSPSGVAVDGTGNVYFADAYNNVIQELPYAFVDPTPRMENLTAGQDTLPTILPVTKNLSAPFAPTSDQPWLIITGITNGVVSFSFTANTGSSRTAHITLLGQTIAVTQGAGTYSLGTTALLEGPAAGSNSVILSVKPNTGSWAATANAPWLHLNQSNENGLGSANVVFSYDANQGATRSGVITISGQALTITQAGSTYIPAAQVTTLVSSELNNPEGVAVDGAGNVYIANTFDDEIKKWSPANNTVTTLVSSGLNLPQGVTVDGAGNVYIADTFNNAIKMWAPANNTVATLVSSGLNLPGGVAVDAAGNVYIADTFDSAIKMWTAADSNLTTLVSSGLSYPSGVAVDAAGNVYIADTRNQTIDMWTAASGDLTNLVSSGLFYPYGVAVDGSGNVSMADTFNNTIKLWAAADGDTTSLVTSDLNEPMSVSVDAPGNLYLADSDNNAIKEWPHAFVDPTPKSESADAGSDALPLVLPATQNLLAPFAPTSDQPWLSITGAANGVVSFSFANNTGPSRTANITLLGQAIPVTQAAAVAVAPSTITGVQMLGAGILQFTFTNNTSETFTVLSTTNLAGPLNSWTVFCTLTNDGSGVFQFTSPPTTNDMQRFYRVRSP